MNTKEILLKQFNACYDVNGWFVALKNALEGVTAENAVWKPEAADNSIWKILSHLNFYNNAYLERFKGADYEYGISSNDETFSQASEPSETNWQSEVDRFDSIMAAWRVQLENADELRFAELAPPHNELPWSLLIANINVHNAHHGGQIVLLKKLQGIWDVTKGVS